MEDKLHIAKWNARKVMKNMRKDKQNVLCKSQYASSFMRKREVTLVSMADVIMIRSNQFEYKFQDFFQMFIFFSRKVNFRSLVG